MATLEQVKEFITKELAPINVTVKDLTEKYKELSTSVQFLSTKYDDLLNQIQTTNSHTQQHGVNLAIVRQDLKVIDKRAVEALDQVDELAQYVRRDCIEISGLKANGEPASEAIVEAIGKAIDVPIDKDDISIAHPLPTLNKKGPSKIIVKFKHRKTRNKFYQARRKLAKKTAKDLPDLELDTETKVFISESLTPKRKKLFGDVNTVKKRLKWKFIWTYNGRIYMKQKESSKTFAFDKQEDLQEFEDEHDSYDDYNWR